MTPVFHRPLGTAWNNSDAFELASCGNHGG